MDAHNASYQIIADLLAEHTGQHLTESRRWRVSTALAGVFREYGISNVDQLVCLLESQNSVGERRALTQKVVEALLNNETYFFRDKPTFDQLPDTILPDLARKRADLRRLSIWCAGCSTGQEVHSVAMLFADNPERWHGWTLDILGTDISERAIKAARSGLYSQFEVQRGLGVIQMLRHFDETEAGWQVKGETRNIVRFEKHNVLSDPPARARFDLILCRNVLLYFEPDMREKAFSKLATAMNPGGYLMLGAGETVVGQTTAFTPSPDRISLYQLPEANSQRVDTQRLMAR
ncbi:MAG: protein-glutamate O-methyltransferase CheR [Erythrobacter sp.]|nr:protein-glutamate O-methyltransferase CheR [Erythrobacter sp.]